MVATTGTDASRQAYSTEALTSGNVLCTWTTSGRYRRSTAASSRWDSRLQTTRAGSSALRAADQCSISSLSFSKRSTSYPARASSSLSWSTTRFSPLGVAERYRLWTSRTRIQGSFRGGRDEQRRGQRQLEQVHRGVTQAGLGIGRDQEVGHQEQGQGPAYPARLEEGVHQDEQQE